MSHVKDCMYIAHLRRSGLSIQSYGLTAPRWARNPSQKRNNVFECNFKEFINVYMMAKKVDLGHIRFASVDDQRFFIKLKL